MHPDTCDEWHQQEVDCELLPQTDWFSTLTDIAYSNPSLWTKKDVLEYNRIFEGL